MHARAAALVAKEAQKYAARVTLVKEGLEVNARSIMEVLMLAANQGSRVTIRAEGDDEAKALDALSRLMTDGFGETA